MKNTALALLALAATAGFAGPAAAQTAPTTPFSIEVRGGLTFPTGDFDDGAGNGYDFGANASFDFMPNVGAYAGYAFNSFDGDEDLLGADVDLEIRGFNGGLRLGAPVAMMGLAPYVKGGAVYYDAELSDEPAVSVPDPDGEWGFEVGGGLAIPLGMRGSFTPEVRYTDVGGDVDVSFVTVDMGLRFRI